TRWLGLIEPEPVATTSPSAVRSLPRANRGAEVAQGSLAAAASARRVALAGERPEINIPVVVDTDVLVVGADESAAKLRRELKENAVSFVIARRVHQGELMNYAFKYEEALQTIAEDDERIALDALNLHEYDQSITQEAGDEMTPPDFTFRQI